MHPITSPPERNRLLLALSAEDYARLLPSLTRVPLASHQVLYEPGAPITEAYFLQSAVASMIAGTGNGQHVEVGTVGFEGMIGLPLLFGLQSEPIQAIVQVSDGAWSIPAAAFLRALDEIPRLRLVLLRYAQTYVSQIGQSSACNRAHVIDERCARWLLMTHDRVGQDAFGLTQDFLATMLGVRRAGVSTAAAILQRAGFIRYSRGRIQVLNRVGLEGASCPCYRIIRDSYERVLGPLERAGRANVPAEQDAA